MVPFIALIYTSNDVDDFQAAHQISLQGMARTVALKVASCTILGVVVFVFVARQFMKATVFRKVAIDDFFILIATIFAVGLCLTTFILASEGLGTTGDLSRQDTNILMKGYYATGFLYISAVCLAKLSLLVLFYNIVASHRLHRRTVVCFGIFILAWTVGSLAATAFQCELPRPWMTSSLQCFNTRIFWIVYCIIDVTTETAVILLSINLVAFLHLRLSRKLAVVACFAPRALVIGASLAHLIWLYPGSHFSDPQYRLWVPAIIKQIQICLSICTASIPFMVPYFKSLEGNLRRTYTARSGDFQAGPKRPRSLACFRRERERDVLSSWDSADKSEQQYEAVPHRSPHIPTPRVVTPLTASLADAPRLNTATSQRSLSIRVPDFHTWRQKPAELERPQTRNSLRSSICASPHLLVSKFSIRATSPSRTDRPPVSRSSSVYSDDGMTPLAAQYGYKFHIFPPQLATPQSPAARQDAFVAPYIPPVRAPRAQKVVPTTTHAVELDAFHAQDCSLGPIRALRITKTPRPRSPQATSSPREMIKKRASSSQDLDSPMWEAINYYFGTPDGLSPASPSTPVVSAHRGHARRVWSPCETASTNSGTGTSSPARHSVLCNEWCLPREADLAKPTWSARALPPLRKARPTLAVDRGPNSTCAH